MKVIFFLGCFIKSYLGVVWAFDEAQVRALEVEAAQDEAAMEEMSREQYRANVLKKLSTQGEAQEGEERDSFYDPKFDYSLFTGRVTDRDKTTNVLKISSENKNTRFFRTGDKVNFRMVVRKSSFCEGFIRSVEKGYFIMYVSNLDPCFKMGRYFRRGSMLFFSSEALATRVKDASLHRLLLIKRKRDFYHQLNELNHLIWTYPQERVKLASGYDQKVIEIKQKKERALEDLRVRKEEGIDLQKELVYRLDQLEREIEFYRIDKDELLVDRWHLDHDLGLPVKRRPVQPK